MMSVGARSNLMLAEIREQPEAIARLLVAPEPRQAGILVRDRKPRLVRFVAHGSSDNAAVYGSYAFAARLGARTTRASLSSLLAYDSLEPFDDDLVVALSQSGETADVVAYAHQARERGGFIVALTNDPMSSLALVANFVIPLQAGVEQAIPATKTYLNELVALALVVAHASGDRALSGLLEQMPDLVAAEIERHDAPSAVMAESLATESRLILLGRGYELATAREVALKLKEVAGIAAEPLSALEVLHGPIAELIPGRTVLAFCSRGALLDELRYVCHAVRSRGANVIAIGNGANDVGADRAVTVAELPEALAPLLSVLPGQLLAFRLAEAKATDPARPPGLSKVVHVALPTRALDSTIPVI